MLKYLYVGNIRIPAYGMMVLLGIVFCNCLAQYEIRKRKLNYRDFLILECIAGIGAIVGAKAFALLKLICSSCQFPVSSNELGEAGWSYFGGLAGFFLFLTLFRRLCGVDIRAFADLIWLIPLLHFFWKIGCFMGGCCFGVPYHGVMAIVFPEGVNKLAGFSVFPIQLLEAVVAMFIAINLFIFSKISVRLNMVGLFLLEYGITRFFMEFLRYHANDRIISENHIYSVIGFLIGLGLIYRQFYKSKEVQ